MSEVELAEVEIGRNRNFLAEVEMVFALFLLLSFLFRSFFPSPATVFILFSLSCWSFSLNFGGVFEDRDPQITFGLSGCRVKPGGPTRPGRRGSHTTARELQTCTFHGPGASNTTKIPRKDKKERERRKKIVAGKGKKKREILGPPPHPSGLHPSGLHLLGAPLFLGLGLHPRGLPFCGPKIQHPKIGRSRNWPNSKKKAGRSRNWPKSIALEQ